ncbi:MAG: FmdC precursor [Bacteroidetes bacterium]|nr:MAG: FmdC precursor [Bacteroidota bacterium]
MKRITKILLTVIVTSLSALGLMAQNPTNNTFGKGIKVFAKDTSFSMKFSTRIQNQYEGTYTDSDAPSYSEKFYLRRARLKFDGNVFCKDLIYKIELDVVNAEVLDAVLKWRFYKNFSIWFGQTKLPGNRERVISSQKLQFVDRSLVNAKYNLDRDKGIQIRHHVNLGDITIREMVSVSIGEGKNYGLSSQGNDYTGRVEVLPLGDFTKKGDYFEGDLFRESKPKLALGFTYGFNDNAIKSNGQKGDIMTESRDINSLFGDLMFKYNGFSVLGEYANKTTTDGSAAIIDTSGALLESFYTGTGMNFQMGYLLKNNWEFAVRYTSIVPETVTQNSELTQYTLCISKYVVGHSLKVQSDFTLSQQEGSDEQFIFRLQVEMAF